MNRWILRGLATAGFAAGAWMLTTAPAQADDTVRAPIAAVNVSVGGLSVHTRADVESFTAEVAVRVRSHRTVDRPAPTMTNPKPAAVRAEARVVRHRSSARRVAADVCVAASRSRCARPSAARTAGSRPSTTTADVCVTVLSGRCAAPPVSRTSTVSADLCVAVLRGRCATPPVSHAPAVSAAVCVGVLADQCAAPVIGSGRAAASVVAGAAVPPVTASACLLLLAAAAPTGCAAGTPGAGDASATAVQIGACVALLSAGCDTVADGNTGPGSGNPSGGGDGGSDGDGDGPSAGTASGGSQGDGDAQGVDHLIATAAPVLGLRQGRDALARTGAQIPLLLGALLVLAGAIMLLAGRRRTLPVT